MDNERLLSAIVEQFELMQQRVDARFDEERASVGRQFELMQQRVDARFEQIDARFDDVYARFDQVDRRFDDVYARFDQVDARFDDVYARFDQVDARFDNVYARFDQTDARFDRERATVAGQFELFQKRMDQRFNELAEALEVIIGSPVPRQIRPNEGG
jgi:DNA anti-recombination protein RmuC